MALAQEDLEQIQWLIKKSLAETPEALNANVRYELDLRERTIRVEEELRHQRELMTEGFKHMDKRFEQMQMETNIRFEQVDKRLELIQLDMNKRFEQVDKRFEQINKRFEQVDKRFEQMQLDMNKRFEQVDKRFEQMQLEMNKRFEQVDKRFDQQHQEIMGLHHEIKLLMRWSFGALIAVGSLMVAILRISSFWPS
ncbi:MAG: hypothetical protein QX195_05275 [Methylococcaceae bacterium]